MATIFKTQDGRWRAQVRKQGMPSKSRNFTRKADDAAWAAQIDAAMSGNAGTINAPSSMTMADIIHAYQRDASGANLDEWSRKRSRLWPQDPANRQLSLRFLENVVAMWCPEEASGSCSRRKNLSAFQL